MRRLVKRVKAGVDRRVALAHRLLHGVTREVVDEYLLDQVRHHIRTRRVAAPGPRLRVVPGGASEGGDRLPHPISEMDRVREVRDEYPGGRPRSVLLPVAPVLVRDAEVVCRTGRIARGDACTAVGQRVAVPEVLVGDRIKARAGAELHQDSAFPVPPSKARNLRVVAVTDPVL